MVIFHYTKIGAGSSRLTLRTDKTIKLWKVFDKQIKVVSSNNHHDDKQQPLPTPINPAALRLPSMQIQDRIVAAVPRKVYQNAHAYHVNSISINSDGETFISGDDLRINLWNLNISDQSFSGCTYGLGVVRKMLSVSIPDSRRYR